MKSWKCYTVPFTDRDGRRVLHCGIYIPFTNSKVLHCVIVLIYICLPTEKLQSRWCSAWYLLLPKTDNREEGRRVLHCIMYAPYQQRCRKVGGMLYYISLYPAECYSVWCIPHTNITNREAGKWVVQCITSLSTQQNATLCNVSPLTNRSRKVGCTVYYISLSTQQSATLCNVSPKLPTEKQESGWYNVLHLSLYPTERKKGSGWRTRS